MSIKIGMTPSHPGSFIRNWVLPDEMTVRQAAEHLGVGRQALDAVLNGRSAVSAEMALRIEKAFGPDAETLMRMQVQYDAHMVKARTSEIAATVRPYKPAKATSVKRAAPERRSGVRP